MKLTVSDFEMLFGGELPAATIKLMQNCNFYYTDLSQAQDNIILRVLKKIDQDALTISGEGRKLQWENGWKENLQDFLNSDGAIDSLTPKYYRPNNILRLNGRYIKSESATFEFDFFRVFRHWLCSKYLVGMNSIFEFGCGSGHNLPILAKMFPNAEISGLDWVQAPITIVNEMRNRYAWNLSGHLFDLFNPDYSLPISDNSAFITVGALEQLGYRYKAFVDFALAKKPSICINIEPLYELYNPNCLLDYLAMKYHIMRGYLITFLTHLQFLEKDGKVKILDVQRMNFGGLFHDGWSRIIWCPK
jgi:hypothetical protein